jgi:hypothetical protein
MFNACGGGSSTSTSSIPAPVSIVVIPLNTQLNQGATLTFSASVTGTSNTAVTWSVREGAAGGSITAGGLYTAPNAAGTFHVVATSQADSTQSSTANVVVSAVTVSVTPGNVSMGTGESVTFSAQVTGTVNHNVTWSIREGAAGGTVTSAGLYTAAGLGTFHVVATSVGDNTTSNAAVVTVAPLSVSIAPTSDVLGPAGVRVFVADVVGSLNKSVTWSVQEGAAGGSVTATGQYTAPNTTGTAHVVATSVKDPTKSAIATVTLSASGFRPTGDMSGPRTEHTATLLKNGKVLVAGGNNCFFSYYYYSCTGLLGSAELYDPASGAFAPTGAMSKGRAGHTATLLTDGRVLIAGGFTNGANASAELYDPATGTFTATGSMSVGRGGHTATLLSNGKVLIAGGGGVSPTLASAELFDPATGTFSATGSMASPRNGQTATLLANGKVLIAGGSSGSGNALAPVASAEVYDPASGAFTSTGAMVNARANHAAALLANGNVLIVAGSSNTASATAEIYDAGKGTFAATGPLLVARNTPIAVLLAGGMVLVVGGPSATAELFDPAKGSFTQTGGPRVHHEVGAAALLSDGRWLLTGGSGATELIDSSVADVYKQ